MSDPVAGHHVELAAPGALTRTRLHLTRAEWGGPDAGELLIKVAACAVCRTDLQLVMGDLPAHRLPVVPGHQAVGHIVALGAGVTGWAIGERVRDPRHVPGLPDRAREPLPGRPVHGLGS